MSFSSTDDVLHDIPVLRLSGEIDIDTAGMLRERLSALLDGGSTFIVVDLSGVAFLDSAGLKVLDDAQQDAARRDARLALACPPGRVLRLFEITGLDDHFAIHPDAERAATDAP